MIAVIDYEAGNIFSVLTSLKRLNVETVLTSDLETIRKADKVIFPGQGEARSAMRILNERGLAALIPRLKQPFLGICVGMQLLCKHSEENDTPCLGVFDLLVKKFPQTEGVKVPHVGWNKTQSNAKAHKSIFFKHLPDEDYYYYLHSYYCALGKETTLTCTHGELFSAGAQSKNFYATQFHPEKSSEAGEKILKAFLNL